VERGRLMEREASVGRKSPYELLFGDEGLTENRLSAIRDEARKASVATGRRDQFAHLPSVRELLGDLVPDFAEPISLDRYLQTLHHCFLFWRAGCRHYAVEETAVRSLIVDAPDLTDWGPRFALDALYFELPQNLCWAAVVDGEPPEPVEGMFVSLQADEGVRAADILLVLGVRPHRPGFSVAELTVDLDAAADIKEPNAFTSGIPGADLADLYSLQRSGEVVTLLLRLLWYIESYPESCESMSDRVEDDGGLGGRASTTELERFRVRSCDRDRG